MNYNDFVRIDRNLFRPSEVDYLQSDYFKARTEVNWSPKTTIEELSQIMIKKNICFLIHRAIFLDF
jgi:GDPmannose 4,6-dehydratase